MQYSILNTVAVEALMEVFGLRASVPAHRGVGSLAGSWVEDPAVDEALQEQRMIDDEMWRFHRRLARGRRIRPLGLERAPRS